MPLGPSRKFLDDVGLGEGLIDLPTDELFLRAKRANPDPAFTSHEVDPGDNYSSSRSFSRGMDFGGQTKELMMPQVINGMLVTPDDATKYAIRTKRHYGTYDTPEHADYAGQRLHELQALHDYLLSVGRQR